MYIGNERFQVGGSGIAVTVNDFWRWSFSDFSVPVTCRAFAEFLVASSLELISNGHGREGEDCDLLWTPSGGSGIRIGIKSAAYVQSDDGEHPDHIVFRSPSGRICDAYVFCVSKALAGESPLNMDLWDFYSLRNQAMDKSMAGPENLSLSALMGLEAVWSDYYGIGSAILSALSKG